MGDRPRTTARFPHVALGTGHYESFYLKACHPTEPLGIWIRHTVHKRPGEVPTGSVWVTVFETGAGGPWAVKETTSDLAADVNGAHIRIGEARLGPGEVVGRARAEGREASWSIAFECAEEPLRHLPRDFLYSAPLPRTKLLSPYPDVRLSGRLEAGDRTLDLQGWRGMVGHNWGSQHAERWIWMHGAGFEEAEDAWIDVALGRIKVGRFTTPWVANGVLSLGGERHRLGGPGRIRRTEVSERPDGCRFTLTGSGITVQGAVGAAREDFVGWVYADPDGSEHHTVNCSVSDMTLAVSRPGLAPLTLQLSGAAAYELGMREHDHGMAIQPFPDG